MKKEFSFYEFAGVLAPGAVVLFGLGLVLQPFASFRSPAEFQLGGLGIFVVLAYVAGHLTQAIGNFVEWLYWKPWGGMPSEWVLHGRLLSTGQIQRLAQAANTNCGITNLSSVDRKGWYAVVREMNARLVAANRTGRLDIFNGNYGLARGIAAAMSVVLVATVWTQGRGKLSADLALAAGFLVALYRMHRFGVHYARELFAQYLDLERTTSKNSPPAQATHA